MGPMGALLKGPWAWGSRSGFWAKVFLGGLGYQRQKIIDGHWNSVCFALPKNNAFPQNVWGVVASVPQASKKTRSQKTALASAELCKFRIVVGTRRNRSRIVRNRCVSVCGCRGFLGLGLAQL